MNILTLYLIYRVMNVKLKTKKLKSGKEAFYLSYYDPETKTRSKEYLGLYLFDKPKNEL